MRKMEYWLSRVGIGLLLFGLAFLFKYSIDRGWITPPLRHLFGIGLGILLFVFGWRLYAKRRHFAQVLLGGSIGTFYITCFSAFQLFHLIDHTVAFAVMVAVTALAFFIAIKQDDAIFSLIGTAGGLGTPFLLYTGEGNIPGLVGYTCLVLTGTTAVYFFKGWRLLLWLSVFGGWVVMLTGLKGVDLGSGAPLATDQWAIQIGVLFIWLCFWLVPLARRIVRLKNPDRWRIGKLGIGDASLSQAGRTALDQHLHVMAVGLPLVALALSLRTWPGVSDHIFGWACVGATLLYWLTARLLQKTADLINLAFTHAAVGTLLLTIALCLLLDGDTLLFALAGEAAALHLIARRLADPKIAFGAHALFACVGMLFLLRVIPPFDPETPLFSGRALTDLWVVAVAFATAFVVNRRRGLPIYFLGGVIGLALVFNRELSGNVLYFALILEAFALFLSAYWLRDEDLLAASHIGYALLTIWLGRRLIDHTMSGTSLLNYQAATDALLITSGLAVWLLARSLPERRIYLLVSATAFAGLMRRELDGNLLLVTLTAEAVVLHWLAWRRSDKVISAGAHLLMLALGMWMAIRLVMTRATEPALINLTALTDLLTIGSALAICTIMKSDPVRFVYQLASHLAILAWFARELSPLENGQGYVSAAWGIYSALLLVAGLRFNLTRMRQVALGTLLLVVGKLFIVDLSELETIWRVLLFMGFGAVFLLLSYYFPKLWKGEVER
jgi:uncharacterized membrane protein